MMHLQSAKNIEARQ